MKVLFVKTFDILQKKQISYGSNAMVKCLVNFREFPNTHTKEVFYDIVKTCMQSNSLYIIFDAHSNETSNTTHVDIKSDLSPILDIRPPKEAVKEFERLYVNYHLDKNNNDRKKTATSLNMNYNTLKSAIKRSSLRNKELI